MSTGTVQKWGNSLGVRIPTQLAKSLTIHAGSTITLEARDGGILVLPTQKQPSLAQLLTRIPSDYIPELTDWGPDIGGEIVT